MVKEHAKNKKTNIKRYVFLLPLFCGILMYLLLPYFPFFTEYFLSRFLFRIISLPFGFITSLIPLSLTELFVVAVIPLLIFLIVKFIIKIAKNKHERKKIVLNSLRLIAAFLSWLFFFYMLLHGANFYRFKAKDLLNLNNAPKDKYFLQAVCIDLAQKASSERENLAENDYGAMALNEIIRQTLNKADEGYMQLIDDYPFLWGSVKNGKYVFLSRPWSYTGITGMYFPWFCEANINIDQPQSGIPATAAHELAHTKGFAREDECNFYAYLSCINHPDANYRYSGYLLAFTYCQNELYSIDKELWQEARSYCSDAVNRDLYLRNDYWKQFEGPVEEFSSMANDAFISSQGVDEGIESYGEVVELVLAWYATNVFEG